MTSKLVVNTIEADTGISSVSFASSISMSSTSKFHFGNAGIDIGADTNINRPASGVLGFNINSSEKARIDSSGQLGIGTISPDHNLHVYNGAGNVTSFVEAIAGDALLNLSNSGNGNFSGINFIRERGSGQTDRNGGSIFMPSNTANNEAFLYIQAQSTSAHAGVTGALSANNGVRLKLHGDDGIFSVETGADERFRILANGAVGINTSNFSSVLNNEVGLAIHGSSNDNCRINLSTPNKSNTLIGYYGLSNRFGVDVHNGLEIRDVEDSYATRLRIDSSGRVLIGTTTEGYNPDAQTLTIAESGNSGMTIRSGASSAGHIYFSDATSGAGEYVGQIGYNHSSNYLWFGANSNEKIRITNGGLDPSTDGATDLGNSSKRFRDLYLSSGIFLGGTTSSNELEDYEEGLWTPQMLDGNGSNYVITKDTNNCYYTKIGRMVFVYYVVTNAENGSKTGNLYFPPSCLPFTPSYSALGAGSFWVDHSSPSAGLGDIIGGLHNVGSSGVYFVKPTDKSGIGQASTRYLQHGQWSFGRPLYGSFSYKV